MVGKWNRGSFSSTSWLVAEDSVIFASGGIGKSLCPHSLFCEPQPVRMVIYFLLCTYHSNIIVNSSHVHFEKYSGRDDEVHSPPIVLYHEAVAAATQPRYLRLGMEVRTGAQRHKALSANEERQRSPLWVQFPLLFKELCVLRDSEVAEEHAFMAFWINPCTN